MAKNKYGLNYKQQSFVDCYLSNGCNATRAYMEAYGAKVNTADSNGPRLLNNEKIQRYLKDRQEELKERSTVKAEWVIDRLKTTAERCLQKEPVMYFDKYDKEYCQEKVELFDENGNPAGTAGVYKFDSLGAVKSLELLGKTLGMFTDKIDTGNNKGTGQLGNILIQIQKRKEKKDQPQSEVGGNNE